MASRRLLNPPGRNVRIGLQGPLKVQRGARPDGEENMRQVAYRALLAGLLFATAVFAQRDLGTMAGTVTDPTGAAIPDARVTITEVATNLSYTVSTNANGEYVRPALKPGIYTVSAEAEDSGG